MVNNSTIIKKIYFPRLIIPISSALSAMFDFIVCLCIYLGFIFFFKNVEIRILDIFLIPISALLLFFSAFGIGTLISALAVKYRDFRYILPFILQLLLFISPVFLLISPNSSTFFLFSLNPLVAPLQMFRYHLTHTIQWDAILISILSNFFLLFLGLRIFKKMEDYFADLS